MLGASRVIFMLTRLLFRFVCDLSRPSSVWGMRLSGFALVVILGLFVFQPPAYSVDEVPAGWEQLVKAAQREGALVIYGPSAMGRRNPGQIERAFENMYPNIKIQATLGSGSVIVPRLLTERRAGWYIPDVLIGGTTATVITLKPAGVVVPLRPHLLLPEVVDKTAWLFGRLPWADTEEPYTTLMFQGYVQSMAYVNTKLVDPRQFKSYWDLLNPKWKGKIVSSDIRRGGRGGVVSRFAFKNPQLGPEFFRRLFSEMDITLSSDPRQMVDWLAKGRYHIALFLSSGDIGSAQEIGLPVAHVQADQFKEGAPIAPGGGAISLLERAPHPNAAALFINWLLSREGQAKWQEAQRLPSLRVDISKEGLYPYDIPKPGIKYVMGGTEEYSRVTRSSIVKVVTKALSKARR